MKEVEPLSYFPCKHFIFFIFSSFVFLGPHLWHMEVPRLGSNRSYSCRPTPQPQQHGIPAVFVTYTTAHGNVRSLTHWARAGIEPATLWFLVGFVNHCATTGSPNILFCNRKSRIFVKASFFFPFFRATPEAYRGSQAGSQIGATAAGLHHSHSNAGSEPYLWRTRLMATPDP